MIRRLIKIDERLCNGCTLCVTACHEGAIGMNNGKAVLLRDDYCDGLGDCLPACPTGAINFELRDTVAFDKEAVDRNMEQKQSEKLACGCPGTNAKTIRHEQPDIAETTLASVVPSELRQWPVQIRLVPVNAPYFANANLLIAGDCAAYAYGNFHNEFMKNKITVIGCPKLDACDYGEKLSAILAENIIQSVTVIKMNVPCCEGIKNATFTALQKSGKQLPQQIITIATDGTLL